MKVALILFNIDLSNIDLTNYYTIGVDEGALNAINNKVHLDLSIGDFDSVNKGSLDLIYKNSSEVIKLNPIKDETDTEEALKIAYQKSNDVTIFGGIQGRRIEHFLSILGLLSKYKDLRLIDNNSFIFIKDKSFTLKKDDYKDYKFFSIFSLSNDLLISLKGFKYNLVNYNLKVTNTTLTVSNQMIEDIVNIDINNKALFILSKLDNQNNID